MPLSAEHADIAWMLLTSAMVVLMQAGFCCLETGPARAKNGINVATKNLSNFCVSSVLFCAWGFELMFGKEAAWSRSSARLMLCLSGISARAEQTARHCDVAFSHGPTRLAFAQIKAP